MAKVTHTIRDLEKFIGVVWETKIGRIITLEGTINPKMGWIVRNEETGEDIVSSDMVDVLADILPFEEVETK